MLVIARTSRLIIARITLECCSSIACCPSIACCSSIARLCDMPEYHTPEGMPPLLPAIFLCWIQYTNVFLSMLHGRRWNAGKHRLNRHYENTGVHDSRTSHTNTEVHKLVLLGPGQCCLLHDTIPHILDLDLSTIHSRGS